MAKKFSAQIFDLTLKYKQRTDRVTRQAFQEVLSEATRDIYHGGRMRVDTGFLRSSLKVQSGSMPSGPTKGRKDTSYPEPDIALQIARTRLGGTIYAGWTADYARPRESIDGFAESAAQKWQQFVRQAVLEVGGK